MARAETMETGGGGGGGGGRGDYHAPLPRRHTCSMETPRPTQSWPIQTAATTILHLQPQPLQGAPPLPSARAPAAGAELRAVPPRARPTPRPRLCSLVEDGAEDQGVDGGNAPRATGAGPRRERTDSENEDEPQSPRAPLPDLLPRREHPGWASPPRGGPGEESGLEGEGAAATRRVAHQLRTIGDDLNATLLQRAEAVAPWQGWTGVCRGLVAFLAETLHTLHRFT